tara:strand:+ start:3603 stop:4343 length:741 start_codon:yes stop_codon:yes gene_type:complete
MDENSIVTSNISTNSRFSRPLGAMTLSLSNILEFLTILSPFMLTFFIIMFSVINDSIIEGLIFLAGLVIVCFIIQILKMLIREPQSSLANPMCNILPFPFTSKGFIEGQRLVLSIPLLGTSLLGFILSYMVFPMYVRKDLNLPLIIFLVILFLINCVTEYWRKCASIGGVILSGILGVLFGVMYYSLISSSTSANQNLADFSKSITSAQGCSKPGKKKFICKVKNGRVRPSPPSPPSPASSNSTPG